MRPKLTKEIVNERLRERPIQLVGEYVDTGTKTKFACDDCGGEWLAKPNNVMRGSGCHHCNYRVPLTKEIVNERLKERPIQLVGKYVNVNTKAKFACDDCGGEFLSRPHRVMQGRGCAHCAGNALLTREIVNERLSDRPIQMVGEYVNTQTKAKFACDDCGGKWLATPNCVMNGNGCPHCSCKARLTKEIVNRRLSERPLRLVGEYVDSKTKTKFACDDCGGEWLATPDSVMQGHGCPSCAGPGFDSTSPATLYYLRVENDGEIFYKIGITNNTVSKRFAGQDMKKITVLFERRYEIGADAKKAEQEILSKFEDALAGVDGILRRGGNTELFAYDIMGLAS